MADKTADQSGDEREKRIAELKAKMQASAKKAKASAEAEIHASETEARNLKSLVAKPARFHADLLHLVPLRMPYCRRSDDGFNADWCNK